MKLNPEKRFVVEIATLQSMQPLIQWVADLALYLVTLLPATLHSGASTFAGAALLRMFISFHFYAPQLYRHVLLRVHMGILSVCLSVRLFVCLSVCDDPVRIQGR